MKDKRNRHGAVGKSSSEQHFRKSAAITIIVWNFWSPTPSATGSYGRQAGWQADEIQVIIYKMARYLYNKNYLFI